MRILIYSMNFSPELIGIGKYSGEMAAWLAARGHEVRVIAAPPHYPAWRVTDGYAFWRYSRETRDNAVVTRCPVWVPKRLSGLRRLLCLASFALSSFPVAVLGALRWRPDVIWAVEPPLACAPGALIAARLCGARTWLHVQDLEVDAAFAVGLLRGVMPQRGALALERWLMTRFDRVSTISRSMLERVIARGVDPSLAVLFPNWVDTTSIFPLEGPNPLRQELGIDPDTVVALYAGNMGRKQGFEVVLAAARRLATARPSVKDVLIVLCGDGPVRKGLIREGQGLPNVRFLPLQPVDRLNGLLNLADLHLLPQRADAAELVMPSKLTGMLASGRPVIATAQPESEVGIVVGRCGVLVPAGDDAAFARAIAELAQDGKRRLKLGRAARRFVVAEWDRQVVLDVFEGDLVRAVRGGEQAGAQRAG